MAPYVTNHLPGVVLWKYQIRSIYTAKHEADYLITFNKSINRSCLFRYSIYVVNSLKCARKFLNIQGVSTLSMQSLNFSFFLVRIYFLNHIPTSCTQNWEFSRKSSFHYLDIKLMQNWKTALNGFTWDKTFNG